MSIQVAKWPNLSELHCYFYEALKWTVEGRCRPQAVHMGAVIAEAYCIEDIKGIKTNCDAPDCDIPAVPA